jgi:hypothetical protein
LVRDAGPPGVSQHYPQVEAALKESGVREGLALVNAMHITASVFINDDERGLHARKATAEKVDLRGRLGALAKLTVHEPPNGSPRIVRWKPSPFNSINQEATSDDGEAAPNP